MDDPNDNPANGLQAVKITALPSTGSLALNGNPVNSGDVVPLDVFPVGPAWTARESIRAWSSVASSANGTKLVAVAVSSQIYTSTDSGVTWTASEANRSWKAVVSSADGRKLAVAARSGQIYTSTDSGATWTPRESNREWFSIASSADGVKLVAVAGGPGLPDRIYTSTDSGVMWTARESNRNWFSVASSDDGTKLAAVAYNGRIYTSTDSGVAWTARESERNWSSVASSADGTKLVAGVRDGGRLYTSTDSGVTWTARDTNRQWYSVASSADGSRLAAVVYGGQIYVSANSGATWTPRESNRYWYSIASSADGAKLVAVPGNDQIYTSTAASGQSGLVYTPWADGNGSPYATFTFQVQDDGGTANGGVNLDPSPNTMTIHVTPVNDAPALTSVSALTGATEDTPFTINYAALAGAANEADVDGDVVSFRVEAVSSGTLTKNGTAVTPGSTLLGSGESLVWIPAANANGTLNAFTVKAWDGQAASSSAVQVNVAVAAWNDSPTIFNIADQLTMEDTATTAIAFIVGDVETAAGSLVVSGTSFNTSLVPNANIVFGGSGANRTVAVTPTANQNGTATITVTVTDGVANASDSFVLTVNAVNDAPSGVNNSVTTPEDTAYTFAVADFGFSDPNDNPANDFQSVKIATLPSAGTLTSGGTGVNAGDFVSLTIPAGATWTARASNREWQSVASSSDGTKLVAVVYGGQIYTSTDSGVNWTARESNREWFSVASSADGTKLVAGVWTGQIHTSADSGVTWTAQESNRYWYSVASSADGTKLVAVVWPGQIHTSTDSGVTWTARESNRNWHSVASSSDGTKLVAVTDGQIYTSTDSGANWTARANIGNSFSVASSADGTKLVAGGWDGQIYTSADSGVNWTARESNRLWASVASSADGTKLVATVNGGQVYTSSDTGLVFTPVANANGSPYATFTFQVQDDGGTASGGVDLDPSPNTMTIHVTPVNDAPSFAKDANQSVLEDAGAQTVTNWATSISAGPADEAGQALSFLVSNDNAALFAVPPIIGANGTLTYTPTANANGTATVSVRLQDNGGTANGGVDTSAVQTFTITVVPVNDAPTLNALADVTVLEDASAQTISLAGIGSGAPNEAQALMVTASSSNPALIPSPVVNYSSPNSTGSLSFTPVPNGNGTATITVTVQDNGGTGNGGVDIVVRSFAVAVTPVNDVPSISDIADQTTNEDSATSAAVFAVGDIETAPGDLILTASSSNPALVPHANIALGGVGANRTVTVIPAANHNGIATITVTVSDGEASSSDNFVVTVNPVNDAPSFVKGADQTVLEDAGPQTVPGWVTSISAGPNDEANQTLAFQVSNSNPALFSVPPAISATGTLAYTPALNAHGSAVITVQLNDDGGTASEGINSSGAQTFTIKVNPVNDRPELASVAPKTVNEGSSVTLDLSPIVSDVETPDNQITWSANSSDASRVTVSIDYATQKAVIAGLDDGTVMVTLTAIDLGDPNGGSGDSPNYSGPLSASTVVSVTVRNIAPVVLAGEDQTANEGSSVSLAGQFSDPGTADTHTLSWNFGDGNAPVNGTSTPTHTYADNGVYTVTLTVTDDDGGVGTDMLVVTVNNVAPTVTLLAPAPGLVQRALTPISFEASFNDPGTIDTHTATWTLSSVNEPDIVIEGTVSGHTVLDNVQFSEPGVYSITVTVTDKDGTSGEANTVNGLPAFIVIYDPNGGITTGGGFFQSPAGALAGAPLALGRASFGFTAKYLPDRAIPDGNLEFQFKAGGLNFKGTTLEWLVVSEGRAQVKGQGTINGAGNYGFLLTAFDTQTPQGRDSDAIRIVVWDKASGAVVYSPPLGSDPATGRDDALALDAGSITVHKEKSK